MNVAIYSTRPWDETYLGEANTGHDLRFLEAKLDHTTTSLAADADAVCVFVNELVDRQVIKDLAGLGVRFLALRSAGFNHVDLVQPTAHLPQRARHRGTRPSSLRRQVQQIAEVTIENLDRLEAGEPTGTEVTVDFVS